MMGWQDLVRVVQLLVDHKANVDAQDSDFKGSTVMTEAGFHPSCSKQCLNCGVSLAKRFSLPSRTNPSRTRMWKSRGLQRDLPLNLRKMSNAEGVLAVSTTKV